MSRFIVTFLDQYKMDEISSVWKKTDTTQKNFFFRTDIGNFIDYVNCICEEFEIYLRVHIENLSVNQKNKLNISFFYFSRKMNIVIIQY